MFARIIKVLYLKGSSDDEKRGEDVMSEELKSLVKDLSEGRKKLLLTQVSVLGESVFLCCTR